MDSITTDIDKDKIKNAVVQILEAIGEDPNSEHLSKTPERFATIFSELTSGKDRDLSKIFESKHEVDHNEMVLVKDIPFYSLCEHHIVPFFGTIHIAYIPDKNKIIGLGKLVELVDTVSKKLQLQEKLTKELADTLTKYAHPKGVGVVVEARHLCMEMQGTKQPGTSAITSAIRGSFRKDNRTREEFLSFVKNV